MRSKYVVGVRVDFGMSYRDVLESINKFVDEGGSHYIWTVNPEFVMDAQKDKGFLNLLNESSLSVPDGSGLLFYEKYQERASKMERDIFFPLRAFLSGVGMGVFSLANPKDIGESLTGSDLILKICANAEKEGQTVMFLGGWEKDYWGRDVKESKNIALMASEEIKRKYPDLKIICATSKFKRDPSDDSRTLDYIHDKMKKHNVSNIDIIFVAYNHIYQEKWIKRNINKIPAKVGIGVGGALDFTAGVYKRSKFLKKYHLEWLYRLVTQPWRSRRIIKAFPLFPLFVYYLSVKRSKK